MHDLNYLHLRYFQVVAREGGVTAAAERLRLSPSTISTQVRALEEWLDRKLFERKGRGMVLTDHGRAALEYADDIFSLGEELVETVQAFSGPRHRYRMRVGVGHNLPKLVAYDILCAALDVPDFPVHLVTLQDFSEQLVSDLAVHHLDLVLSDTPLGLTADVEAVSEPLGSCAILLVAVPQLAERYDGQVPHGLDGAPLLLPEPGAAMRRLVEDAIQQSGSRPRIVGEFGDSALLKAFGGAGKGLVPIPAVAEADVRLRYGMVRVGVLPGVQERFFALVTESKRSNPAVKAVLERARRVLGQGGP